MLPELPETKNPLLDVMYVPTETGVEELNLTTGAVTQISSGLAKAIIAFSAPLSEAVCQAVEAGLTLYDIEKKPGMPAVSVVQAWLRSSGAFRDRMAQARGVRADLIYEEILGEGRKNIEAAGVQSARLKLETLRWAAEKGAPDRYGNKTTLIGDRSAPAVIIIDTGVPTKENEGRIKTVAIEAAFTTLGGNKDEKINSGCNSVPCPDSGNGGSSPV